MATVYLHIGLPKTGSTSIQYFVWDNRDVFEKLGICYPLFSYRYEMVSFRRNGHFLYAPYINEDGSRNNTIPAPEYEEGLNQLEELGKKYDRILLTDEGLWWGSHPRKNFWEQLKEDMNRRGLDVKIIVYLRRQDSWLESHWAQNIKDGRTCLTMHEYIGYMTKRGYPLDYNAYISKLADLFGKDSVYVRILERGQFKGAEHTLQSDFLDIFGLSLSDGFTVKQDVYNTKFEGNYLEIKRLMNLVPELRTRQHILFQGISEMDEQNPSKRDYSRYSFFAPEDRMDFQKQFEESNRQLASGFLGREDGILFYNQPKDLPELLINENDFLRDSILLWGKMFDIVQTQQQTLKEQLSEERQNAKKLRSELKAEQQKHSKEIKELKKELKAEQQKRGASDKELRKDLKALREDVFFYRLKRKIRHIRGLDQ